MHALRARPFAQLTGEYNVGMTPETVVQTSLPFSPEDQERLFLPERGGVLRQFAEDLRDYHGTPFLLTKNHDRLRVNEQPDDRALSFDILPSGRKQPLVLRCVFPKKQPVMVLVHTAVFDGEQGLIFWNKIRESPLTAKDMRFFDRILTRRVLAERDGSILDLEARLIDSFFFGTTVVDQSILQMYRTERGGWLAFPRAAFLLNLAQRQHKQHLIPEDSLNRIVGIREKIIRHPDESACKRMRGLLHQPAWKPWSEQDLVGNTSAGSFLKGSLRQRRRF